VTEPRRPSDPRDDLRYPDPRPLRRIQLATLVLIVVAIVVTLTSGSRPAEVRWGTLVGLVALTVVVLVATRRWRARRRSPPGQNPENNGEIEEKDGGAR
jgi:membrane protein implicated in regulation of membrane protease activity